MLFTYKKKKKEFFPPFIPEHKDDYFTGDRQYQCFLFHNSLYIVREASDMTLQNMRLPDLGNFQEESIQPTGFDYLRKNTRNAGLMPVSRKFEEMKMNIAAKDRKGIGSLIVAQEKVGNSMKRLPPAIHHYHYEVSRLENEQDALQQQQQYSQRKPPEVELQITPPFPEIRTKSLPEVLVTQPAAAAFSSKKEIPLSRQETSTLTDLMKAVAAVKFQKRKKRKKKRRKPEVKKSPELQRIHSWFAKMKTESQNSKSTCATTVMAKELRVSETQLEVYRGLLNQIMSASTCQFTSELRSIADEYDRHITLLSSTVVSQHCKQTSLNFCKPIEEVTIPADTKYQTLKEMTEVGCDPIIPQRTALGEVMVSYNSGSTHVKDKIHNGTESGSVNCLENGSESDRCSDSTEEDDVIQLREQITELEIMNNVFLDSLQVKDVEILNLKSQLSSPENADLLCEIESRDKLIEQHQTMADESRQNWIKEKCESEQLKMEVSNLTAELQSYQNEVKRLKEKLKTS